MVIRTIDVHVGGAPVRLIVEGFPSARGRSMADKRAWCLEHADRIRCALMREPRGQGDMTGAVFTEPVSADAHAGLLCLDPGEFGWSSVNAAIAAAAIGLERRLLVPRDGDRLVRLEMPGGSIALELQGGRLDHEGARVSAITVPAQIVAGGVTLDLSGRAVRADVVFAGEHVAIVDAESAGVPLDLRHVPELRRVGRAIAAAASAKIPVTHPIDSGRTGIDGVILTSPAHSDTSAMRLVRVSRAGVVGRSPTGTGIAAVLAVLEAMGVADLDPLGFEGLSGLVWSGQIMGRDAAGDGVPVKVETTTWLTGEHTFVIADGDPLTDGLYQD